MLAEHRSGRPGGTHLGALLDVNSIEATSAMSVSCPVNPRKTKELIEGIMYSIDRGGDKSYLTNLQRGLKRNTPAMPVEPEFHPEVEV